MSTTLSIIIATSVLHNIARNLNEEIPDGEVDDDADFTEIDGLVRQNALGAVIRNNIIRQFFA